MALPGECFSASSTTCVSVESIISGTRIFAGDEFQEVLHVGVFVAVRIGQTDVQHLGAALDLGAADVRRPLELAGADQVAETAWSR